MARFTVLSRLRSIFSIQESGLVLVVMVLAFIFTVCSKPGNFPVMETLPDGTQQPIYVTNAQGESVRKIVTENKFLRPQNLANIAKDTSFIAIMAVGMAVVIISGGIDLSVGAVYALAAVLGAKVLHYYGVQGAGAGASPWLSLPLGALVCIGTGTLCGLVNGGLIVGLGVHPFIITLGTMAILRGIAFVITTGESIGFFPDQLQNIVTYEVGDGITVVPLAVMLLVMAIGWIFLSRLAAGRRVYAVGGNEVAAQYSGIRVRRVKLGAYLWSGTTAGLAALLALGFYGAGSSGDGQGYELNVIAAAVVGGASLVGGRGTALGALLGALIIQMIASGIVILGIDQNYSQIITGTVVVVAVVLDKFNTWLAQRRLARKTA